MGMFEILDWVILLPYSMGVGYMVSAVKKLKEEKDRCDCDPETGVIVTAITVVMVSFGYRMGDGSPGDFAFMLTPLTLTVLCFLIGGALAIKYFGGDGNDHE